MAQAPPNNHMEPTCQSVTPLAFARAAPLRHAAHVGLYASLITVGGNH